jgi:hypothetical protein
MEARDPDETDVSSEDDVGESPSSARSQLSAPSLAGDVLHAFSQVDLQSPFFVFLFEMLRKEIQRRCGWNVAEPAIFLVPSLRLEQGENFVDLK